MPDVNGTQIQKKDRHHDGRRQAQHGQRGSGGTGQDDGVQMVLQAFCLSGFKIRYYVWTSFNFQLCLLSFTPLLILSEL